VREDEPIERIADRARAYFEGPTLAAVPESDAARGARRAGLPLLEHAPESDAARAFRDAAHALDVRAGDSDAVADRFRHAVIPQPP